MWTAKITLAYDGTDYVGWQVQPNGVSVQEKLEEAWERVTGERSRLTASGRTDSGVHALGQVCSVQTKTGLEPDVLTRALNASTPEDISIIRVDRARSGFHAIEDVIDKTYRYTIHFGHPRSPLCRRWAWYIPRTLDVLPMQEAARILVGEHDFQSFQATGSPRQSTVRKLLNLEVRPYCDDGFHFLQLTMTANGFLYNMARNIVGALVRVGEGKRTPDWIDEVLQARDRSFHFMTAPAHGLCLVGVTYPDDHLMCEAMENGEP